MTRPAMKYSPSPTTPGDVVGQIVYPRTVRECILAMALMLGSGVEVDHYAQIGTGTRKERDKALIEMGMEAAREARATMDDA